MVSLLDIAPSYRQIKIQGNDISVPGISLEALVALAKRYPQLVELVQAGNLSIEKEKLFDLGLDVVSSFLAAGLGYFNNPDAEARCRAFRPGESLELATAIIEESFPQGPKSFFEQVTSVLKSADTAEAQAPEKVLTSSQSSAST